MTRIAALLGEPARAAMAEALMSGLALTASELAEESGTARTTASGHLAQMLDAGLICVLAQGRHRYYRLNGPEVAATLEALMGLAEARGFRRCRPGPRDPALRAARSCYDHLAGTLGVQIHDSLAARGMLRPGPEGLILTDEGALALAPLLPEAAAGLAARQCLDWSERRMHLAGPLGRQLLEGLLAQGWARRGAGREVLFTPPGTRAFDALFPVPQGSAAVW
ncbi:ArsR/SmtB family transcription factor [Pseudooceanicola sp. 200-1SW]|uniref:ArsR/SmtB family transcription factor n=1 Tax=Pseudooceanicola sp. 200-1SW TaxID=3425949 RepID=UPI003D7F9D4C